jgi:hypothetical protein
MTTTTMPTTPVSADRVLAGALRLSLVPLGGHHQAIEELRRISCDQDRALLGALERLERDRERPSRGATMTKTLLEDTLMVVRASAPDRPLASVA